MDVLTSPTASKSASSPLAAGTSAGASISGDFDAFLGLLTAQIRNQDPLQPAEGTEFVAQLATFSNVEQAVKSNALLEKMVQRLDRSELASAATWIGMEVGHSGPVTHDGTSREITFEIPAAADSAELVLHDSRGSEVLRLPIDPRSQRYDWPGAAAALPAGQYQAKIEARSGDQDLDPMPVSHFSRVREVAFGTDGAELVLEGGQRLPVGELQTLRGAGS